MSIINNLKWEHRAKKFEWDYDRHYLLEYVFPLNSVVILNDGSGFAVVLSEKEYGRNNAVIINADGTERARVTMPVPENQDADFCAIFYMGEELIAMINRPGFTQECTVNDQTGECSDIHMAK